jgi:nucleoside-diphosphate-sugar epimerase
MTKRILITGNMGYVGPVLSRHLRTVWPDAYLEGVDAGWFAHSLTAAHKLPETALNAQRFADVRSLTAEDLKGFDGVVQLAAVSNDPMGNQFEEVTDAINHRASVSLARAAQEAGVKSFVFASSCSLYGAAEDGAPRREGDAVNPLTAYARSKIDTERDLATLNGSGMVMTALRFATACGMSDRLRLDLVLNDFVATAMSTGRIEVLSDGTPWRPLIHVNDMARAIEWALDRKAEDGGEFLAINAGSEQWNYQVVELAGAVAAAFDGASVSINKDAPPDKRSYRVNFDLFKSMAPNHQPQVTLEKAIEDLKTGVAAMGGSREDFERSPFIRLKVLDGHLQSKRMNADLQWDA